MRSGTLRSPALALPLVFLCGALSCLLATWVWRDAGNLQWMHKLTPSSRDRTARIDGGETLLSDAERLHQKIRILCLVVTHPGHHLRQAQHVHATWSKRCSRVLFVTNTEPRPSDPDYANKTCQILGAAQYMGSDLLQIGVEYCGGKVELQLETAEGNESTTTTVKSVGAMPDVTKYQEWRSWFDMHLPILEVKNTNIFRDGLWNKTMNGFLHARKFFLDDFDWFLKADDDTYVIMENLRSLLQHHKPEEAIYFGCHFKGVQDAGYMSGGGGYVLSRAAVKRFADVLEYESNWTFSTESEDVAMGQVMREGGVKAGDSHDSLGRARFFPLSAAAMASPDRDAQPAWYWQLTGRSAGSGPDQCSPTTISFHYMTPGDMYTMEMMLYHVKIYGMAK